MSMREGFDRLSEFWHFSHAGTRTAMFFSTLRGYRPSDFHDGSAFDESTPVFVCETGSKLQDVMATTVGFYLVSDAFSDALRAVAASGWRTRPAVVFDKKQRHELYGLSVFFPLGKAGKPLWSLAPRALRPPRAPGAKPYTAVVGLILDKKEWDGSDVFWPQGTTLTCVTQKVARALQEGSLSNVQLVPASEFEVSETAI